MEIINELWDKDCSENKVWLVCPYCGLEFVRYRSGVKTDLVFCSHKCKAMFNSEKPLMARFKGFIK